MQYVVHAYDFKQPNALEHRMEVRPQHLDGVRLLKERGQFILGGALLDHEGRMVGSMMIVQFDSPGELKEWLEREPYIVEKVWEHYDIHPFREAIV